MTSLYIKKLNIKSFGKFEDEIITLDPHFNLFYGLNESGKTTIKNFIGGIFYGFDEGRVRTSFSNKREIYRPKASYIYAGEIEVVKDGIAYLLSRDFDSGSYRILNLDKNEYLKLKESDLNAPGKFFLNLDYDIYKSYISSEQLQSISSDSKKKVLEKLVSSDIDYNFSIKQSLENLDQRLKEIGTDRAYTKPYYKTKEKMSDLSEKIREIESLKKNFYRDYQVLDKKKESLREKEKNYEKKKLINLTYNKKRSDENFKSYRKWSDKLYDIEKDLENYEDIIDLDMDDLKEDKAERGYGEVLLYSLAVLILVFLGIFTKKYLILLFTIPFAYLLIKNKWDEEPLESEYNNVRRRYLKYQNLIKEREKTQEVLEILKKQDLGALTDIKDFDFDFDSYDNLKETENLDRLEIEIKEINGQIHSIEKKLLAADNVLKNEASLRDDLKYQSDRLENLKLEIEAINLAKATILEIADDNKADIRKLNNKIKLILRDVSKDSFDIDLDYGLDLEIKDRENFTYNEDQLSKGFFDQVNLALKLSLMEDISKNSFLIFDDAFINYDIERIRKFLYILLDEASFRQIIYFTCHKREEEFLKAENIGVNIIQLEDR
ncbi:ATP-binding protein [uncultured Anaerococcus sp.]|uniref:ATP-binding protein n=1 Tax=uncultured Anaerococcus sp. TaxID=293428 RepID=UPI0025E7F407|nr:AAA family ATPase [uncultured Anaerococcus sp.]